MVRWGIAQEEDQSWLGQSLGPVARHVCDGRLGEINWFRATWQHGGAATGFSTWRFPSGQTVECVVKLPIGYHEYFWTKRLGLVDERGWDGSLELPTPRVLAAGFELGGYDLAWVVMERFPGSPVGAHPTAQGVWEVLETAAEFHAAAIAERPIEPELAPEPPDWEALIERSARAVEHNDLEPMARWRAALDAAAEAAPALIARWRARDLDTWCHMDLHARNAMRRRLPGSDRPGRCVLIDLAMVRPGCWIEDALYLERLGWGHEDAVLCGVDAVAALGRARSYLGLPVADEDLALADVRRVLAAASAPAFIATEGDRGYLERALTILEGLLPRVRS